jgi:hypothetical protein
LYNVITTVIKEFWDSFKLADLVNLSCANKDFWTMITVTFYVHPIFHGNQTLFVKVLKAEMPSFESI